MSFDLHFADRLITAVREKKNPVCVGLDPRWTSLPTTLRTSSDNPTFERQASDYQKFCEGIIDVVAPLVPIVKPQAAFFEQLGPAGMVALGAVVKYAKQAGLIVVMDGKRNDIGSTATGYADAYLGADSPWQADSLTVSPYLGSDSLTPFVSVAEERNAGIFVLVKTSNPGGGQFQDLQADGKTIYHHVADYVESLANDSKGSEQYGAVGAVVGATYPEQLTELRARMPHTWFLVPGYGSQGGTAADVADAFDPTGLGAMINSSRGIIFAYNQERYQGKYDESNWQAAVEAATKDMIAALQAETPVGKL